MKHVTLVIRDPGHLEAHRKEFFLPLGEILSLVRGALDSREASVGEEDVFVIHTRKPVGRGGLARVWPWTGGDYWKPRTGRAIPSHLIRGRGKPVRTLCVWGDWKSETEFILHTVYAGLPAPREMHDPALTGDELKDAVRFWTRHAILSGE